MLKVKNLKKSFGGVKAVDNCSFEIKPNTITALIGPNGAGKSTIFNLISGISKTDSGEIIFSAKGGSASGGKDKDITKLPTHQLISLGISYVPQGRQIFANLTVRENLEMGAFIIKDKELIKRNLEDVYSKFPFLKERSNQLAQNLSGGEQQMLAIGRALIQDPELILLDEPSLGLAPKVMKEVFNKIVEINKEGISVIIVEQNAKQAINISNKTYIFENGEIALEGGKEILVNPKIKNIYLGGSEAPGT